MKETKMVENVKLDKPAPYMNPLLAGILLGIVLLATFVVTGHSLLRVEK